MKNFYEATATKEQLTVTLIAEPIGRPDVLCKINETVLFDGIVDRKVSLQTELDISAPLVISVVLRNKIYTLEYETAFNVIKIDVSNIEIVPRYVNEFTYDNDQQASSPTNYLGFNGTWKIDTKIPFLHWWHCVSGQGWLLRPTK